MPVQVVIPDVPDDRLPQLAALANKVRERFRGLADAVTRKAMLAAAQQSNSFESNERPFPPAILGPVLSESGGGGHFCAKIPHRNWVRYL